jgi:transposase-like protein
MTSCWRSLTAFQASEWDQRYPPSARSFDTLSRGVRATGHFPSDDAATMLLFLILNRSEKEWRMPPREWTMAKARFAVIFGERFIKVMAS